MGFKDLFTRKKKQAEDLNSGLNRTREGVWSRIAHAVAGKSTVDEEVLDNLEEALITSDVGVETTLKIIDRLTERVKKDRYVSTAELNNLLTEEICDMLAKPEGSGEQLEDFQVSKTGTPHVILVVGVNGAGKTTTIGKLAHQYKEAGNSVMLGAADTYRAAAIEQLEIWAERAGVPIVRQNQNSDPAAVAFDTLSSAKAHNTDVVIIDTAGRLHNKKHLMDELTKIKRVMKQIIPDAPQEILLVIDGSTGQNAFEQAREFTAATDVNCLAVTKLDGTAKGGVVIGISDQMNIPIKYIGIGEKITDLQIFHAADFVKSLFRNAL